MKTRFFVPFLTLLLTSSAFAQVTVSEPWVRATVRNQHATGAFMSLNAQRDARLVEARSPAAKIVELHEMAMEGEIMKMRAVPSLSLSAGKPVDLKPGGYHIMLIDLKAQLKENEIVPLTLTLEYPDGQRETMTIDASVKPLTHNKQSAPAHNMHSH